MLKRLADRYGSNINLNECLIEAQPYEEHLIELESAKSHLSELQAQKNKADLTPVNPMGTKRVKISGMLYVEASSIDGWIKDTNQKISDLTVLCDSEASRLEELRNDITKYTEIGLEINYTNVIKTPENMRTDDD